MPRRWQGLYTNKNINDLSSWGFNNAASAYKQVGGWRFYDSFTGVDLMFSSSTSATYNCNMGSYNDRTSSVRAY